jgi:hypothetical protein
MISEFENHGWGYVRTHPELLNLTELVHVPEVIRGAELLAHDRRLVRVSDASLSLLLLHVCGHGSAEVGRRGEKS